MMSYYDNPLCAPLQLLHLEISIEKSFLGELCDAQRTRFQ